MKKIFYLMALLAPMMLWSCGAKTNEKSQEAKDNYTKALSDSIRNVEMEIDSCRNQIDILTDNVNTWQRDFYNVSDKKNALYYTILTSWRDKYPLKSTGLIARINDSNDFELVAVLEGKRFNRIRVNGPEYSAISNVVAPDQGLNYFDGSLNSVAFTGEAADSIGNLIADNELNPVSVTFINSGQVASIKLPAETAKMISYTYLYAKAQKDLRKLQTRLPMLDRKLNLLNRHLSSQSSDKNSQ